MESPTRGMGNTAEILVVNLNEKTVDYDRLLELIFEYDKVVTWP